MEFPADFNVKVCALGDTSRHQGNMTVLSTNGTYTLGANAPLLDRLHSDEPAGRLEGVRVTVEADGEAWLYVYGHCTAEAAAQLASGEKLPSMDMDKLKFSRRTVTAGRIRSVLLVPKPGNPELPGFPYPKETP